jgi:hypothetical protein
MAPLEGTAVNKQQKGRTGAGLARLQILATVLSRTRG